MGYYKTIVCLANSTKKNGYCIAGKVWEKGQKAEWIRPVSHRSSRELSKKERCYDDKSEPNLLDIIIVPCEKSSPEPHQRENHLIDPHYYWEKEGSLAWEDLQQFVDSPESLWQTGNHSYSGKNNRVPEGEVTGDSLLLISVKDITLRVGVKAPEYPDSRRVVRGYFYYGGVAYLMDVTDPFIEQHYLAQPDGDYSIKKPLLCISLSDPYKGHCYKLITSILDKERFL